MKEPEEWRTINDWPDYEVSSYGKVRKKVASGRYPAGHILGERIQQMGGYRTVLFRIGDPKDRKFKNFKTANFVCRAFHGPKPKGKHCVAHKDDNRLNDYYKNLRWATNRENMLDKFDNGRGQRGIDHKDAKLNPEKVREIRKLLKEDKLGYIRIARLYGVTKTTIEQIKTGRAWRWVE